MKTLKEFLKPDWRKILVLIIIFFIFYLFNLNKTIAVRQLNTIEGLFSKFYPLSLVFGRYYICGNEPFVEECFELYWINFIITIITVYLISCLIIWIYDKVKKK